MGFFYQNMRRFTIVASVSFFAFVFPSLVFAKIEISDGSVKALYHLEDTADSSGNGYNLTNNGTGSFISALLSNGYDQGNPNTTKYLDVASNLGITGGAITMSGWVKLNAEITSSVWVLFQQFDTGNDIIYEIYYDYNAGTPRLIFVRTKSGVVSESFSYNITLGTSSWHHLVLKSNGTSYLTGLVDGSQVGAVSITAGNGSDGNVSDFHIGSEVNSNNYKSVALYDEVVITNNELTSSTISSLYNSGAGQEVCTTAGCASGGGSSSTSAIFISNQSSGDCINSYAWNASGTLSTTTQACHNALQSFTLTLMEILVFGAVAFLTAMAVVKW